MPNQVNPDMPKHSSMDNHPRRSVPKTFMYHPIHGKKCVSLKEAKDLALDGWYDTPAKFPSVKKKVVKTGEPKETIPTNRDTEESEIATLSNVVDEPEIEEEELDEGPTQILVPGQFPSWSKQQLEDFVVVNGLADGLDLRKTKESLVNEVLTLVQEYNERIG